MMLSLPPRPFLAHLGKKTPDDNAEYTNAAFPVFVFNLSAFKTKAKRIT